MPNTDPRIDAYIKQAAPFAQPILSHLRGLIHQACPEVVETMKWSFPHFDYKGVFCSMASFKEHCAFTFWKAQLMPDPEGLFLEGSMRAMGQFGRITSLSDLPSEEVILSYLKEAVALNDRGVKRVTKKPTETEKRELKTPPDLLEALQLEPTALQVFEQFSYSHKKEYIQWIEEAKTEPTRLKRIATTVEWVAEGKGRNWKFKK